MTANKISICRLYLVRHGESVANRDGLVGGHFDSPLSEKGREQAQAAKTGLADIHFDAAYSSDLQRAAETAAIIFGKPLPHGRQLKDLRERHFGRLEGQSADEWMRLNSDYEKRYASLSFAERLQHNYADFIESDKSVLDRFTKALLRISKNHLGETVLVGVHGGPIRIILMHLGFAPLLTAGSFGNGGYVELLCDGETLRVGKVVGVTKPVNAE